MADTSRRGFLRGAGLLAASLAATAGAGCSTDAASGPDLPSNGRGLTWWDAQEKNLQPAKERIFAEFAKSPGGLPVEYTQYSAQRMPEAMQLAKQSGQLPDIHTNVGLGIPVSQLISGGWVAPIQFTAAGRRRMNDVLIDGLQIIDGKIYTFPIYNYHQYIATTWINTDLVRRAGLDPDSPPRTYAEFRRAARGVWKSSDGASYGWVWMLGMPERITAHVNTMAQAAGFEGGAGIRYRSGEYAYHDDAYLEVMDFLLSLKKDGLVAPGAESWNSNDAMARWMAGVAGYFFEGPWTAGSAKALSKEFAEESMAAGPVLVPRADMRPRIYNSPDAGASFWLSPTEHAEAAGRLLSDYFTTREYSRAMADAMGQPPQYLDVVEESDALPAYKRLVRWYREQVHLAPVVTVRNPDIHEYLAETAEITPGLGDIVQGAFTGDVTDVRAALRELSDKSEAERERALAAARRKGARVDVTDWEFPDWRPGVDFTPEMYR